MSMTYDRTGHQRFSGAVNQFDYNQPNPRKGSAMRKLTLEDVSAISRAESGMYPMLVPNMSPYHRQKIEDDLERLAFVKQFLLKSIYEPGLPICVHAPEDPKPDGDTHKDNPNCG